MSSLKYAAHEETNYKRQFMKKCVLFHSTIKETSLSTSINTNNSKTFVSNDTVFIAMNTIPIWSTMTDHFRTSLKNSKTPLSWSCGPFDMGKMILVIWYGLHNVDITDIDRLHFLLNICNLRLNEHFKLFLRPSSLQLTPGSGRPKIAKIPHIVDFSFSSFKN